MSRYKSLIRWSLPLLLVLTATAQAELSPHAKAWIDSQVTRWPGVTVMAAEIRGDGVHYEAFGHLEPGKSAPPNAHTVYEIGSITKVFTHLLLAEMVAENKVSYQTTLAELLPSLAFANPKVGEITLLELATHTSGLPRLPANLAARNPADPYAEYDEDKLLTALREIPANDTLDKDFGYSNFAVGLLGYLLGQVEGKGYGHALGKYVLTPLEMHDTQLKDTPEQAPRLAPPRAGNSIVSPWHLNSLSGAGEIRSTAAELVKLIQLYFQPKSSPLNHDLSKDLEVAHTMSPTSALTPVWFRAQNNDQIAYWHNGGTGGYRSFIGFNPDSKTGVILLSNHQGIDPTQLGLSELGTAEPPKIAKRVQNSADYIGHFALAPNFILSITEKDGRLYGQATGQPQLSLEAIEGRRADRFRFIGVPALIQFHRNDENQVHQLTLTQGGVDQVAKRTDSATPKTREEIEIDPDTLNDYLGRFALSESLTFHVKREGDTLLVNLTGQPYLPVLPYEPDRFFYKTLPATLKFNRENGRVVSLTLIQGGAEQVADKLE